MKPHDANKIHVNFLWKAEIQREVVAGQYLGKGEGIGLMGRDRLDINTIKKPYLGFTREANVSKNSSSAHAWFKTLFYEVGERFV